MTSHLFGGIWCASSSMYALRRTVDDFPCSDEVHQTVNNDMYVDDLLKSVPAIEEAKVLLSSIKEVLKCGGFNLTKFLTNSKDLLEHIPAEDRAAAVKEIKTDMQSKALGIKWDIGRDEFSYISKHVESQETVTKRGMLSQLSSMYDPLGLVSLVVHQGKALFQQVTGLKLPWDDPVPPELAQRWLEWLRSLQGMQGLTFPRCICPGEFVGGVAALDSASSHQT